MSDSMNVASIETKSQEVVAMEMTNLCLGKDDARQLKPEECPIIFTKLTKQNEVDKTNPYPHGNKYGLGNLDNTGESIKVFGHATCRLDGTTVVISGGFGEVNRRHERWQHVTVYEVNSGKIDTVRPHLLACGTETAGEKDIYLVTI